MQRTIDDGIVIACDFCGTEWDQVRPMIEGHRGSILCLDCLRLAESEMAAGPDPFKCTLCLRDLPQDVPSWRHRQKPQAANPDAALCADCLKQATRAFADDPEVDDP